MCRLCQYIEGNVAKDEEAIMRRAADEVESRPEASQHDLHGSVFGWRPPDVVGLERLGATRMRQYIRAWINEWDLLRLDPGYRPDTEILDVASDYREAPDLEAD